MKEATVAIIAMLAALVACARVPSKTHAGVEQIPDPLFATIAALDAEVFDAFNHCSEAGQLQKHASYFASDVEFYHDTGGVTWTRDAMLANTAKYVCGKFRRERVPGTLGVFPVKDFGAIERGVHRFCQFDSGTCEGMADFVIVWRHTGDRWEITRVLSFGHRPSGDANGSQGAARGPKRADG